MFEKLKRHYKACFNPFSDSSIQNFHTKEDEYFARAWLCVATSRVLQIPISTRSSIIFPVIYVINTVAKIEMTSFYKIKRIVEMVVLYANNFTNPII